MSNNSKSAFHLSMPPQCTCLAKPLKHHVCGQESGAGDGVGTKLPKSTIYGTTPPPVILSNYEICYHYKILEVMHNLNVLGLKKSFVQMLQQFLPHHTKFSCHI